MSTRFVWAKCGERLRRARVSESDDGLLLRAKRFQCLCASRFNANYGLRLVGARRSSAVMLQTAHLMLHLALATRRPVRVDLL